MGLKILILGSGGREHALAWIISRSKREIEKVYVLPGNAGTLEEHNVFNVDIELSDHSKILDFAKENNVDLVIIGPEVPLVNGISDLFEQNNINVFGPKKFFAQLEGSKIFSKNFMKNNNLPTANYKEFSHADQAKEYLSKKRLPIVIKYDGLAAGKGVDICESLEMADQAITKFLKPKEKIIIEDFIKGIELSAIYICNPNADKKNIGLTWIKDYKSRDEYNEGPNTGGMGAITHPFCNYKKNDIYGLNVEIEKILIKTIVAINSGATDSSKYNGFLYLGLMISADDDKPYILEYNCRMGDPETQNLILHLDANNIDFLDLIGFDNSKYPDNFNLSFINDNEYKGYCCTVVLAANGYPADPNINFYIDTSNVEETDELKIFHAGTRINNGSIQVIGGRILSLNAFSHDKQTAIDQAYDNITKIRAFEDCEHTKENPSLVFFRKDIGS